MNKNTKKGLLLGILILVTSVFASNRHSNISSSSSSSSSSSPSNNSSEKIVRCTDSKDAIKKAIDLIGRERLNKANILTVGRLKKSFGSDKYIGIECNTTENEFKLRLDYDPEKGFHYNVEIGSGAYREKTAFTYDGGSKLSYCDGVNSITSIVQEGMVGVKINNERVHSGGATTVIAKKNPDGTYVTSYDMQLDMAIKSVIRYFLSIIELDYHSDINHAKMAEREETITVG